MPFFEVQTWTFFTGTELLVSVWNGLLRCFRPPHKRRIINVNLRVIRRPILDTHFVLGAD